ncbi:MAG TPA: MFS transporter [Micromonosporaceae bacterium]|nr:MFS transporter [Micromonosporaceae bacterium]
MGPPTAAAPREPPIATQLTIPARELPDVARIQRRTLRLLFLTQVIGGLGVAIGITVGAMLATRLGGVSISGLTQSAAVVGGALLAIPVARIMNSRGRRPGLTLAYLVGALGGALTVTAAIINSVPLLFAGMLLFGGGSTAGLQARYTAVDLALPARRGKQLSIIVWATTIGAVAAPNLAGPADRAVAGLGLPELSGPFFFSAIAFALAAGVLLAFLRPDPLLTARQLAGGPTTEKPATPRSAGLRPALKVIAERPAARLGVAAVAVGHLVMVGVMSMTPVHIGGTHAGADALRIVGIVLSLHIAGMYALSPVVGWLTDRLGRRPIILTGVALLIAACAVAGTAGHDTPRLSIGLILLGLGWSCTMVAGSTLLSESVPAEERPSVQGLSDLMMGLAGASAGALSGFVVDQVGYPVLNLLAAVATVPLIVLALRPSPTTKEA